MLSFQDRNQWVIWCQMKLSRCLPVQHKKEFSDSSFSLHSELTSRKRLELAYVGADWFCPFFHFMVISSPQKHHLASSLYSNDSFFSSLRIDFRPSSDENIPFGPLESTLLAAVTEAVVIENDKARFPFAPVRRKVLSLKQKARFRNSS